MAEPCDDCGDAVEDALARTVRLRVDGSTVDNQRLCPDCFAEWISRYEREMKPKDPVMVDDESDIIVD